MTTALPITTFYGTFYATSALARYFVLIRARTEADACAAMTREYGRRWSYVTSDAAKANVRGLTLAAKLDGVGTVPFVRTETTYKGDQLAAASRRRKGVFG